MSLYVGNLSARTQKVDLERVFRRYGPCIARIKDGYGFVVYESHRNAEIALRELCRSYNLSWSNKQPRQGRSFVRGGDRRYAGHRRRDFAQEENYGKQALDSSDRSYKMSVRQVNGGTGFHSADISEERDDVSGFDGYVNRDDRDRKEFQDQGDRDETDLVGNDRWGDHQYGDRSNEIGVEREVQFDRYEPYQDYERKNDNDDYLRTTYSAGSPTRRSSRENARRDYLGEVTRKNPGDVKFLKGCFVCGEIGHKMSNCPIKKASQRRFSRFDQRHENDIGPRDRGKGELQKYQNSSVEKQQSSRDDGMQMRLKDDVKSSGTEKNGSVMRNGVVMKGSDKYLQKELTGKKRNMKENVSPEKHKVKKSRRVSSSPRHSDNTRSGSHSMFRASKHVPRSHSNAKSRSLSSRADSSSDSQSKKARSYSRLKSPKSRSKSSSPTSLSLSVSIGQPITSSLNKVQLNQKGSSDNVPTPESNVQPQGIDLFEDVNHGDQILALSENVPSSSNGRSGGEDVLQKDNAFKLTTSKSLDKATSQSTDVAENGNHTVEIMCHDATTDKDYQHIDVSMMDQAPNAFEKSDSEVPLTEGHSNRICQEELQIVLKHYGLDIHDENERHLSVDAYFGSARLWPWEVIYYRRLKKGPISVENYAKRVEQNKEFSIIDKYIRSSSGWGESDLKNS